MREQLLADVESLIVALKALPSSAAVERAIYHGERLQLAIRTSHNEGTRFAAFTVNKIVGDLGAEAPTVVVETMARVRAGLEARGLELRK
jgi:hypothetical protein